MAYQVHSRSTSAVSRAQWFSECTGTTALGTLQLSGANDVADSTMALTGGPVRTKAAGKCEYGGANPGWIRLKFPISTPASTARQQLSYLAAALAAVLAALTIAVGVIKKDLVDHLPSLHRGDRLSLRRAKKVGGGTDFPILDTMRRQRRLRR